MDLIAKIFYNLTEVHPFHTLIVHFPVALIGAALFFILLALWRRSDTLEKVAFANLALASLSSLVAGITGIMDNAKIYDGTAPNASVKIVLAIVLLLVTAITSFVRWRNPGLFHAGPVQKWTYVAMYFVAFILVSVLGFLGGVIIYGFEAP